MRRVDQSMHIYMENIPAKFHSDMIFNDSTLGFYEDVCPNKNNNSSNPERTQ